MPSKPLEPGDPVRLGRFELLARLGEGGQGVVYLGRGTGPGEERVAVKVLQSSVDAAVLQRLAHELDAVHQVQPFVTARVIEASVAGDRRFIVSEFIDGPSLQERVDARGPLPEGDLHRLAVGTATALIAIHGAGVVHRDFKPANVLLGPDGPRVVDFGIARLTSAATITSGLIGTPCYIAPEQLAGARASSAVDIFAWAATMMFAATGRQVFGADNVPAVMYRILHEEPDLTGLPSSLLPIVRQCLDKDPGRRPSARDLMLRLVDPSAQQPLVDDVSQYPGIRDTREVPPEYAPYRAEPGGLADGLRVRGGRAAAARHATRAISAKPGAGALRRGRRGRTHRRRRPADPETARQSRRGHRKHIVWCPEYARRERQEHPGVATRAGRSGDPGGIRGHLDRYRHDGRHLDTWPDGVPGPRHVHARGRRENRPRGGQGLCQHAHPDR